MEAIRHNIICGTGHRPDKLGGYGNKILIGLINLATAVFVEIKPSEVISGIALGWDTAIAIAAIRMGIPLTCAVPFAGQERMWTMQMQDRYKKILSKANRVVVVSKGDYSAEKMMLRNKWMVNHSDLVLALWNGTSGGTANCIRYAKEVGVPVKNVWNRYAQMQIKSD